MKIQKGKSRIAIVGDTITLKFPNPKITRTIKGLYYAAKKGNLQKYLTQNEKHFSFSSEMLRGWFENLREWRLSQEFTDIVVPTRFSIFGLLNIQDTAKDVEMEYAEIGPALRGKIPDKVMLNNGQHTITGSDNFGWHDGKLKIRDYGELGLDFLLENYRDELREALAETMAKIQAR